MPRKLPIAPTCFVPSCPAEFVGQAGKVAEMLLRKAERLRTNPDQPLKLLVVRNWREATGKVKRWNEKEDMVPRWMALTTSLQILFSAFLTHDPR